MLRKRTANANLVFARLFPSNTHPLQFGEDVNLLFESIFQFVSATKER